MAAGKPALRVKSGTEDFAKYIKDGYYYVDKTQYLRLVFDADDRLLILRPRRFGKTLMMSTLKYFLEMNYENPGDTSAQQELFKGLKVMEDEEFCESRMGKYPVVSLTLKDVKGDSFDEAYVALCYRIGELYSQFKWLLDSDSLDEDEKKKLRRADDLEYLITPVLGRQYARNFLKMLCNLLTKHCGVKPVILIDEYDVPLQKAAVNVFYKDMIGIIGPMLSLSEALKSNDENVSKGILTGCLRATKEGIFTGLNNFTLNTVLTQNRNLCTALGFTPDEVRAMLSHFGLEKLYDKAREYYDGYSVYGRDLFCPWDVTSYIGSLLASDDPAAIKPEAFWNNTSNSDVITHFMPNLNSADAQRFQDLLDGKSVKVKIDEGMSYGDYDLNNPAQFWNVLVYTGCLTLAKRGTGGMHEFRIPNAEMRQCFEKNIKAYYDDKQGPYGTAAAGFVSGLLKGDPAAANTELDLLLRGFVSIRDSATRAPKENFYQGFINGLFAAAGEALVFEYRSNRGSGDGYADVLFKSKDRTIGVVLELKAISDQESLEQAADLALEQIDQKDYAAALKNATTKKIYGYGIAFCGRECVISFKKLNSRK
ncbi:MAG: AAA family ATPase [Succinivibrio sp.]|nr:AAA family ATPase [Succinivibrio sp.]